MGDWDILLVPLVFVVGVAALVWALYPVIVFLALLHTFTGWAP